MRNFLYCLLFILGLVLPACSSLPEILISNPQSDILTSHTYSKMLVEVISVTSCTPTKADLQYLKAKIRTYCHKEDVEIIIDPEVPYASLPTLMWYPSMLGYYEFTHSRFTTVGDTLVIRILYLPGINMPDITARGVAYGPYSFVLYRQQVALDHERAVLLHEFGHLIGLVNCGTRCTTEHQERDPNHVPHCRNEKCVMYWCSPDGQYPDFDTACKLDITANGGK